MRVPLFFIFRSPLFLPLKLLIRVYKNYIVYLFILVLGLIKSFGVLIKETSRKTDLKYILGLIG